MEFSEQILKTGTQIANYILATEDFDCQKITKDLNFIMPTILKYINNQDLLLEKNLHQLEIYLLIEDIIKANEISFTERKQFIQVVLNQFLTTGMDLEKTSEQIAIDIPTICRILKTPYIKMMIPLEQQNQLEEKLKLSNELKRKLKIKEKNF